MLCSFLSGYFYVNFNLPQCAAVKFVSGTGQTPDACTNSTGVSASFADDSELASLVGNGEPAGNATTTASSTPASSTPTETETETPGAGVATYGSIQGPGSLVVVAFMVIIGAGLMA